MFDVPIWTLKDCRKCYGEKEYLKRIISDALQDEAQELEYSINEERAGEQY